MINGRIQLKTKVFTLTEGTIDDLSNTSIDMRINCTTMDENEKIDGKWKTSTTIFSREISSEKNNEQSNGKEATDENDPRSDQMWRRRERERQSNGTTDEKIERRRKSNRVEVVHSDTDTKRRHHKSLNELTPMISGRHEQTILHLFSINNQSMEHFLNRIDFRASSFFGKVESIVVSIRWTNASSEERQDGQRIGRKFGQGKNQHQ